MPELNVVKLKGWQRGDPGINKVELTKLVQISKHTKLGEAKGVTDRVVEGEDVEIEFTDRETAETFCEHAAALGVQVQSLSVQ